MGYADGTKRSSRSSQAKYPNDSSDAKFLNVDNELVHPSQFDRLAVEQQGLMRNKRER